MLARTEARSGPGFAASARAHLIVRGHRRGQDCTRAVPPHTGGDKRKNASWPRAGGREPQSALAPGPPMIPNHIGRRGLRLTDSDSSKRTLPAATLLAETGARRARMAVEAPISTKRGTTGKVRLEESESVSGSPRGLLGYLLGGPEKRRARDGQHGLQHEMPGEESNPLREPTLAIAPRARMREGTPASLCSVSVASGPRLRRPRRRRTSPR